MKTFIQCNQQELNTAGITYIREDFSPELTIHSKVLEDRAHLLINRCQQLLDQIKEKTDRIHQLL
jgi:hypothetical protein